MAERTGTYVERLRTEVQSIEERLLAILAQSEVEYQNHEIFGLSPYVWVDPTPEVRIMQHSFASPFEDWTSRFLLVLSEFPADLQEEAKQRCASIRYYADRAGGSSWSVPESINDATDQARGYFKELRHLIDLAEQTGAQRTILIPDTNAVIRNPALETYGRCLPDSTEGFDVVLVSQVITELDRHKEDGSNTERQKKAQNFIRRVRSLAQKGRLDRGVTLTRKITVKTMTNEVDPRSVLDRLDPLVPDDRILAAGLKVQSENPGAQVILVTGDFNLEIKANSVGMSHASIPKTDSELSADLVVSLAEHQSDTEPWQLQIHNKGPRWAKAMTYKFAFEGDVVPNWIASTTEEITLKNGETHTRGVPHKSGPVQLDLAWTDELGKKERVLFGVLDTSQTEIELRRRG